MSTVMDDAEAQLRARLGVEDSESDPYTEPSTDGAYGGAHSSSRDAAPHSDGSPEASDVPSYDYHSSHGRSSQGSRKHDSHYGRPAMMQEEESSHASYGGGDGDGSAWSRAGRSTVVEPQVFPSYEPLSDAEFDDESLLEDDAPVDTFDPLGPLGMTYSWPPLERHAQDLETLFAREPDQSWLTFVRVCLEWMGFEAARRRRGVWRRPYYEPVREEVLVQQLRDTYGPSYHQSQHSFVSVATHVSWALREHRTPVHAVVVLIGADPQQPTLSELWARDTVLPRMLLEADWQKGEDANMPSALPAWMRSELRLAEDKSCFVERIVLHRLRASQVLPALDKVAAVGYASVALVYGGHGEMASGAWLFEANTYLYPEDVAERFHPSNSSAEAGWIISNSAWSHKWTGRNAGKVRTFGVTLPSAPAQHTGRLIYDADAETLNWRKAWRLRDLRKLVGEWFGVDLRAELSSMGPRGPRAVQPVEGDWADSPELEWPHDLPARLYVFPAGSGAATIFSTSELEYNMLFDTGAEQTALDAYAWPWIKNVLPGHLLDVVISSGDVRAATGAFPLVHAAVEASVDVGNVFVNAPDTWRTAQHKGKGAVQPVRARKSRHELLTKLATTLKADQLRTRVHSELAAESVVPGFELRILHPVPDDVDAFRADLEHGVDPAPHQGSICSLLTVRDAHDAHKVAHALMTGDTPAVDILLGLARVAPTAFLDTVSGPPYQVAYLEVPCRGQLSAYTIPDDAFQRLGLTPSDQTLLGLFYDQVWADVYVVTGNGDPGCLPNTLVLDQIVDAYMADPRRTRPIIVQPTYELPELRTWRERVRWRYPTELQATLGKEVVLPPGMIVSASMHKVLRRLELMCVPPDDRMALWALFAQQDGRERLYSLFDPSSAYRTPERRTLALQELLHAPAARHKDPASLTPAYPLSFELCPLLPLRTKITRKVKAMWTKHREILASVRRPPRWDVPKHRRLVEGPLGDELYRRLREAEVENARLDEANAQLAHDLDVTQRVLDRTRRDLTDTETERDELRRALEDTQHALAVRDCELEHAREDAEWALSRMRLREVELQHHHAQLRQTAGALLVQAEGSEATLGAQLAEEERRLANVTYEREQRMMKLQAADPAVRRAEASKEGAESEWSTDHRRSRGGSQPGASGHATQQGGNRASGSTSQQRHSGVPGASDESVAADDFLDGQDPDRRLMDWVLMRALFDFTAETDQETDLVTGDVVRLMVEDAVSGANWWGPVVNLRTDAEGIVPRTYLQYMGLDPDAPTSASYVPSSQLASQSEPESQSLAGSSSMVGRSRRPERHLDASSSVVTPASAAASGVLESSDDGSADDGLLDHSSGTEEEDSDVSAPLGGTSVGSASRGSHGGGSVSRGSHGGGSVSRGSHGGGSVSRGSDVGDPESQASAASKDVDAFLLPADDIHSSTSAKHGVAAASDASAASSGVGGGWGEPVSDEDSSDDVATNSAGSHTSASAAAAQARHATEGSDSYGSRGGGGGGGSGDGNVSAGGSSRGSYSSQDRRYATGGSAASVGSAGSRGSHHGSMGRGSRASSEHASYHSDASYPQHGETASSAELPYRSASSPDHSHSGPRSDRDASYTSPEEGGGGHSGGRSPVDYASIDSDESD